MAKINHHFQKLIHTDIEREIEEKLSEIKKSALKRPLLNLALEGENAPVFPCVLAALKQAIQDLGKGDFSPFFESDALKKILQRKRYPTLSPEEIFLSSSVESDIANIQEIFSQDNKVGVMSPSYPLYVEIHVLAGRTRPVLKTGVYGGVSYLSCREQTHFEPSFPLTPVDLIYLCTPNNPTGTSLSKKCLKQWVDFARKNNAVLLMDFSYRDFASESSPRSIYEIEGAKEVAIEFCSFSQSARLKKLGASYMVIPKDLKVKDTGKWRSLHTLWQQRIKAKPNPLSYPALKAALSLFSQEGDKEWKEAIASIRKRALELKNALLSFGYTVYGGEDAPYLWCKTPPQVSSWEFFDFLLENAQIISTPGVGFGKEGEGFIRLSAFAEEKQILESIHRFRHLI